MLKANGAGGDYNIAGLDVQINAAAGAGTDEGVRAALMQIPVEQAVTFSPSSVPVQTLNSRL